MNSMQDALQTALEHPIEVVRRSARHMDRRDYFWWAVMGYILGAAVIYRLYRRA